MTVVHCKNLFCGFYVWCKNGKPVYLCSNSEIVLSNEGHCLSFASEKKDSL